MDEPPKIYEGESLSFHDIADQNGVMRGMSFVNCELRGPAVLVSSQSYWGRNRISNSIEYAVYDLPPERREIVGAFFAFRCHFEGCLFRGVGFMVHPDQIDAFKRGFDQA